MKPVQRRQVPSYSLWGELPKEGPSDSISESIWASLVAQTVKKMPAIQETQVQSLRWEDSLQKGMATHSSILAWEVPWAEGPGGLPSEGLQRVWHGWVTNTHLPNQILPSFKAQLRSHLFCTASSGNSPSQGPLVPLNNPEACLISSLELLISHFYFVVHTKAHAASQGGGSFMCFHFSSKLPWSQFVPRKYILTNWIIM